MLEVPVPTGTRTLLILAVALCAWPAAGAASAGAAACGQPAGRYSLGVVGAPVGFWKGIPTVDNGPTGPFPHLLAWGRSLPVHGMDLSGDRVMGIALLVDGEAVASAEEDSVDATITMAPGSRGVGLALSKSVLIGDPEDGDYSTCDAVTSPVELPGGRGTPVPWKASASQDQYGEQLILARDKFYDAVTCAPFALSPATLRVTARGITRSIAIPDQCDTAKASTHCKLLVTRAFRLAWSLHSHEDEFIVNGLTSPATVTLKAVGTSRTWHMRPGPNRDASFDGTLRNCPSASGPSSGSVFPA